MDKFKVSEFFVTELLNRGWYQLPKEGCVDKTLSLYAQRILCMIYDIAANQPLDWSKDKRMTVNADGCEVSFAYQSLSDDAQQRVDPEEVKASILELMSVPFNIDFNEYQTGGLFFNAATIKDGYISLRFCEEMWSAIVRIAQKLACVNDLLPSITIK